MNTKFYLGNWLEAHILTYQDSEPISVYSFVAHVFGAKPLNIGLQP